MSGESPPETAGRPWEELGALLAEGSLEAVQALVERIPAGERAHTFALLDEEQRLAVMAALRPEIAAEVVEDLPDSQGAELLEGLERARAAAIVEALPSAESADVLAELDDETASAILKSASPAFARSVEALLSYEPHTAGGIMVTEYVSVPARSTVADVLHELQENVDRYADYQVQYVYAVGDVGDLVGVVPLRRLVLARPHTPITSLMVPDPLSVPLDMPLEHLSDFFDEHDLLGVPVVDATGVLLGIVRAEDVREAEAEHAEAARLRFAGIVGGDELRSMPLGLRARRRLSWLSINILLDIVSASVIAFYQHTLAAVIALAVFLPIVSDMSGNSGIQAVAVSLRELSLGIVRPREALRVWLKEVSVGFLNGICLGLILAVLAWLWKGNPYLGVVVGVAMAANSLVAVTIGGVVPLALKRAGIDPALASGPILTTVTDMCGFFLVLSLATWMLPRLTP